MQTWLTEMNTDPHLELYAIALRKQLEASSVIFAKQRERSAAFDSLCYRSIAGRCTAALTRAHKISPAVEIKQRW